MKIHSNKTKRRKSLTRAIEDAKKIKIQQEIKQRREEYFRLYKKETNEGIYLVRQALGKIVPNNKERKEKLVQEASLKNFYRELGALLKVTGFIGFNKGRKFLFLAIAEIIEYGGENYPSSLVGKIKEAGNMLNQSGGINDMKDSLIWSFIPKDLHKDIELYWDGIGEWKV